MIPDPTAHLRAESLAATLAAARGRRVRRRSGRLAFAALTCAVVALFLLPRRTPAPALIAKSPPPAAPLVPRSTCIIHTPPGTLARIATRESHTLVRFSTGTANRVERIDTDGLARCFPDQAVAVIHAEGALAKVVVF